ncbi:MAG: 16S rRNA (adenine(1518)-N(6)/adenine(1519)-N(6))-dimethyltransferase RsmA [Clostridia bacterium]|nr:16S rRNA (adenine(1518)-N(6)/adenine(1519)-N(6))-dimethyltransferase RsmA [Clostridia bacterium]
MEVKEILKKHGFVFKKQLGQNFLTEGSLLRAIVKDAGVTENDTVVEIGTGAGTLTQAIAEKAKKVYTFDVDTALLPVLNETLAGRDNITLNFIDVLKCSDEKLKEIIGEEPFKVVANIPYYVTTPLIMRFLESTLKVESLTVMVQKEVADRLVAEPDTENYGAITLAIEMRGVAKVTRPVSRMLFHPAPKVDSAVVHIAIDDNRFEIDDRDFLRKLIRAGFQMRRKTLVNNIGSSLGITKDRAKEVLVSLGYSESIRGEALSIEDYIKIAKALKE